MILTLLTGLVHLTMATFGIYIGLRLQRVFFR